MIKHILFDLDGTLLPMKQDEFVKYYLSLLAEHFSPQGIKPELLIRAVWAGVNAMVENNGTRTNEDAFWEHFEPALSITRADAEPGLLDFYQGEFNKVSAVTKPTSAASDIIKYLGDAGINIYLATNPIFPRCATLSRIRWAGLDAEDFKEITTYETYHYSKPNVLYFQEIMNKYNLDAEECLMVGNDAEEDLSIRNLGVKTYLVTDCLENKKNLPLTSEYAGTLTELLQLLQTPQFLS